MLFVDDEVNQGINCCDDNPITERVLDSNRSDVMYR